MTYNATDSEALDLGFALPSGTDLISGGDEVIRQNAKAATGGIRTTLNRLEVNEATLENLSATATTLDYGQPATVTVTGTRPAKVIHIGIPKGMPDDVGQQLVTDAQTAAQQSTASAADAAASAEWAQQAHATTLQPADAVVAAAVDNDLTETYGALFNPEPVNALRYGIVADGTADDTAAIMAAVAVAKDGATVTTNRAVVIPEGPAVYIDSVLDLRYLTDVRIERQIKVGPNGLVLVGHSSNQRPGQRIYLKDVRWSDPQTQTNVTVRAVGMKQANVTILRASHVELLADDTVDAVNDGSLAYNTFNLGRLDNLTLRGVGPMGWITQNLFIGGDVKNTLVTGEYGHNENTWLKTCIEGGTVTFESGARNRFLEARCESGTVIAFGVAAGRNYVEDSFVSNSQTRQPGATVIDDGVENVYVGIPDLYYSPEVIASVDTATRMTDKWSQVGDAHVPGIDMLTAKAWTFAVDTGVFPVRESTASSIGDYEGAWRCVRFQFMSDAEIWRPSIYLYDENMQPVTTAGAMSSAGGWGVVDDVWTIQVNRSAAQMVIQSPSVRYARIRVRCGPTGGTPFRFVRVTAYPTKPAPPVLADYVSRRMSAPIYQSTRPTQGIFPLGTLAQSASATWKVTGRADTVLGAAASSGATVVDVAAAAGVSVGDVIGVTVAGGVTHWSTVSALSGTTVTLAEGLSADAPLGARVATIRWT